MRLSAPISVGLLACCLTSPAWAEMSSSLTPVARPTTSLSVDLSQQDQAKALDGAAEGDQSTDQSTSRPTGLFRSLFPVSKPKSFAAKVGSSTPKYAQNGSICGVRSIRGQAIAAIPAKLKGCGLANPVKITEVAGVKLSRAATVDCTTAKALHSWVEAGAKPAARRIGGGLSEMTVVASYACRTRNNQPGAKVSEHGAGRAIDVAGFTFKDGSSTTLLKGWNSKSYGGMLRQMHKSACGPFGTVLGPQANKYHLDHFHFDTARYRSGSYCR